MMSTSVSLRRLYRSQIATARFFDVNPGLKSLLSLSLLKEDVSVPARILQKSFLGGSRYLPSRSLVDFVRAAYRQPLGEQSLEEATSAAGKAHTEMIRLADLAQVFTESADGIVAGNIDAQTAAAAEELSDNGLLEGQLAESSSIRPGVLLLEHPADVKPGRAVVLVYDVAQNVREIHNDDDWVMRGFVVNRPLPSSVAAVTRLEGLGALGDLPCFHGGPSGGLELSVIHRFGDIEGSVPVDGPPPDVPLDAAPLPDARCELFVGGSIEAINKMLESGRAKPQDFRVYVGHFSMVLEKGVNGDLAVPDTDRWIAASGPGVAPIALCSSVIGTGPYRDVRGLKENVIGYNHARFAHQNLVWGSAIRRVAAWMETSDSRRGREVASFADPWAHAAVATLYAAGWTHADLSACLEDRGEGRQ